jgi:endonuclease III
MYNNTLLFYTHRSPFPRFIAPGDRSELEAGCSGKSTLLEKRAQTVLDSLVRTILSQNTTDKLSQQAFDQLKQQFPTWRSVLAAPAAQVEAAIKIGGLAQIKLQRIKVILETILAERPQDCPGGACGVIGGGGRRWW